MAKRQDNMRERLIAAAHDLARRKGFDRTSVTDILEVSGGGRGSFFHYFPNKESLGLTVLKRDRKDFMKLLDRCFNSGATPLDKIECFFAEALKIHRERGFVGGCLWGNTALEMSDSNPVFSIFTAKVFDEWMGKLAKVIRAGQEMGDFRNDFSAAELARSAVATIEGGIMLSRLKKDETPLQECLEMLRALLKDASFLSCKTE